MRLERWPDRGRQPAAFPRGGRHRHRAGGVPPHDGGVQSQSEVRRARRRGLGERALGQHGRDRRRRLRRRRRDRDGAHDHVGRRGIRDVAAPGGRRHLLDRADEGGNVQVPLRGTSEYGGDDYGGAVGAGGHGSTPAE